MRETVRIDASDGTGSFGAYVAGPADAAAGIVLIQEIFGVNAGMRAMAEAWGALGYRCVCPDLFWRVEPGLELDADIEAEFAKAFATYQKMDVDKAVADIGAAIGWLRAGGAARVGAVGYCLGGLLAYLTAARTDVDASVGYYGVTLDQRLAEAATIRAPLMLHNALKDGFVPPEAQAAIKAGLAGNAHVTIHDYDADHGFARHAGASRVSDLADQADARTRDFFAAHLA
jgi:carboxymethylenebutenolidase